MARGRPKRLCNITGGNPGVKTVRLTLTDPEAEAAQEMAAAEKISISSFIAGLIAKAKNLADG